LTSGILKLRKVTEIVCAKNTIFGDGLETYSPGTFRPWS